MKKKIWWLLAWVFMVSSCITMLVTFLTAYFNPSKATTVYINLYHEAVPELIIFSIGTILSIYYLIKVCQEYREERINAEA